MVKKLLNNEKFKMIASIAAAAVLMILIIMCVACQGGGKKAEDQAALQELPSQEPIVKYVTKTETVEVEKLVPVEVEKEITTAILREGLQNMGKLVTQEYSFSEVTTVESNKVVLWFVPIHSQLIMGYDGEVLAGVDFSEIVLSKNDNSKKIAVHMPEAEIIACDIDLESFRLYLEDVSRWNPISASDYNGALVELENRVTERALEKGILTKANENAEVVIRNFIESLVGAGEYQISFTVK